MRELNSIIVLVKENFINLLNKYFFRNHSICRIVYVLHLVVDAVASYVLRACIYLYTCMCHHITRLCQHFGSIKYLECLLNEYYAAINELSSYRRNIQKYDFFCCFFVFRSLYFSWLTT